MRKPGIDPSATGYSGTPLEKKLGICAGQSALFIALPARLIDDTVLSQLTSCERLDVWPGTQVALPAGPFDYIHLFTRLSGDLHLALPQLRARLQSAGMIWVSWPKKSARVASDVTEDLVRAQALVADLVDVKVCAVDQIWSGLKLVIPRALRGSHGARDTR